MPRDVMKRMDMPSDDHAATPANTPMPGFYDDLGASLDHAWRLLARGASDRRFGMHTLSVATVGADGGPQARTVVLRGAEPERRLVRFHTDIRSGKVAELRADPRVAVLAYDAGEKVQLRLAGRASLHHGDDVAERAWAATRPRSRVCYTQPAGPGTAMDQGAIAETPLSDGYAHFMVVLVVIESLDWLYLAHAGHRRARFTWGEGDALTATWIAP